MNNIGSIREVLFEKYSEGILSGWTNNYIKVSIKGSKDLLNSIKKVQLIELINNSINGILALPPPKMCLYVLLMALLHVLLLGPNHGWVHGLPLGPNQAGCSHVTVESRSPMRFQSV